MATTFRMTRANDPSLQNGSGLALLIEVGQTYPLGADPTVVPTAKVLSIGEMPDGTPAVTYLATDPTGQMPTEGTAVSITAGPTVSSIAQVAVAAAAQAKLNQAMPAQGIESPPSSPPASTTVQSDAWTFLATYGGPPQ